MTRAVAVVALALCLAGCTAKARSGGRSTPTPTVSPTPTFSPAPTTTAELAIAQLQDAGLAIGTVTEFVAGHDPNPPLRIPGTYAGATWHDKTLPDPAEDAPLGFRDGGTLEVFPTVGDRQARQAALASLPPNGGTVIGQGPYLLLLSPLLAADVVARYQGALPGP